LLKTMSDFLHHQNLSYVLADTQSAQLIAELQQFYGNKNVKEADKAIDVGIERIRSLFQEGRIKIFRDKCNNLVSELQQYHYATPNADKVQQDKPVAKDNHACDALRYAFSRPLQGLYMNKIRKPHKNIRRKILISDDYTGY